MIADRLRHALLRLIERLEGPDPRPVDDRLDDVDKARAQLIAAAEALAVAYAYAEHHPGESDADSNIDYRHDELAEAARDLAAATDALPADLQPVEWQPGVGW